MRKIPDEAMVCVCGGRHSAEVSTSQLDACETLRRKNTKPKNRGSNTGSQAMCVTSLDCWSRACKVNTRNERRHCGEYGETKDDVCKQTRSSRNQTRWPHATQVAQLSK